MNGHKMPRDFERITNDGSIRRLRVPGGWLVHSITEHIYKDKVGNCSEALTFVPDPDCDWLLEVEK